MDKQYIEYQLPSNLAGWRDCWFYIGNHSPKLPDQSREAPIPNGECNLEVNENYMVQVLELLDKITGLRDAGVTRASVMWSWLARRIQPLQKREKFGHKYLSEEDLSRLATGNLTVSAALRMVKRTL